jgi:hypothetical protein
MAGGRFALMKNQRGEGSRVGVALDCKRDASERRQPGSQNASVSEVAVRIGEVLSVGIADRFAHVEFFAF